MGGLVNGWVQAFFKQSELRKFHFLNFSGGVFLSLINEGYRFIRGSTCISCMYGLRTDGMVWVD